MPDETEVSTQEGRDADVVIPERDLLATDTDAELLEKSRDVAPAALRKFLQENGFEQEWLASPEELLETVLPSIVRVLPPSAGPDFEERLDRALRQAIDESIQTLSGKPGPIQDALEGLRKFGTVIINALEELSTVVTEVAADPVTPFNGQFVHSATDVSIAGAGLDFRFTRTYKNQATYLGPLGYNWDHNYNLWIRQSGDGQVVFRSTGSLREDEYRKHPIFGYFVPPDGETSIIESDGPFLTLRTEAGVNYRYQHQHSELPLVQYISRIDDVFGNRLDFHYVDDLLVLVRINNDHRQVRYFYDSNRRLVRLEDHVGRKWDFSYDDFTDLVAVTGPSDDIDRLCRCTCYEYSSAMHTGGLSHNLVRILDAENQLYLENDYGSDVNHVSYNRVIRQRLCQGETLFDYADVMPEFQHDLRDYERPAHQTIITQRHGQRVRQVFNRFGNLLLRDECIIVSGVPHLARSHYRYNRDGLRVAMLGPEGFMQQNLYGREVFQRQNNIAAADEFWAHEQLTARDRQGFQRLHVSVQRNRRFRLTDLTQAHGVWGDIFPDIIAAVDLDSEGNSEDRIRKYTYEPIFGRLLTESDVRFTNSTDPSKQSIASGEHPRYEATLVKYHYEHASSGDNRSLLAIEHPRVTRPDGTFSPPLVEKFTNEDGTPAYDERGRPLRRTDVIGTVTEYTYFDDSTIQGGYLELRTIDPTGLAIRVRNHVDELGRITAKEFPRFVSSADGRFVTKYTYDATDQVTQIISSAPFNFKTTNIYDRNSQLCHTRKDLKDDLGIAQYGGVVSARYTHDSEFNLTSATVGGTDQQRHLKTQHCYDSAGNRILTVLPNGNYVRSIYDERQLPKRQVAGDNLTTVTTQQVQYDGDGNVLSEIDALGNTTHYQYDVFGQVVQIEDPLGNITRLNYDKAGNLVCSRQFAKSDNQYFLLKRTEASFDELRRPILEGGNLFEEPVGPFGSTDLADAELDTLGPGSLIQTATVYDAENRTETKIDHTGLRRTRHFDALGRTVRAVDPLGNETTIKYDSHSNVVRTDHRYVVYNKSGDEIGSEYFSNSSTYDELDRVTTTTDSLGNTTQYYYDSRSNIVRKIDPLGNEIRATFDVFNRAISTTRYMTPTGVGQASAATRAITSANQYDDNGNLIRAIDASGRVTEYEYDALDRNRSTTLPDGSRSFTDFDDNGNIVGATDNNGVRRMFTVDPLGRTTLVQVDRTGVTGNLDVLGTTFARSKYDALGRQIEAENDFAVCTKTLNSFDQAVEETIRVTIPDAARTTPLVTKRLFNDHGAVSAITYPSGRSIGLERDTLNRLQGIVNTTNGLQYPGSPAVADNRQLVDIVYRGAHRAETRFQNGTQSNYRHDGAGRIVELAHVGVAQPLLSIETLYDAMGNVRVRNNIESNGVLTERYAFDSKYQLTNRGLPDSSEIFNTSGIGPAIAPLSVPIPDRQSQMDALIGSLGQPTSNRGFEYDDTQNRTVQRQGLDATGFDTNSLDQYERRGTSEYKYDRNGNLKNDGQFLYFYDSMNRLVEVRTLNNLDVCQFWHDALGRRIAEKANGEFTELIYDRLDVIEEHKNGVMFAQYVHDVGIDQPIHVAASGTEYWYHKDLIGSVRLLSDVNGSIAASYRYDAFGNTVEANGNNLYNPIRYAGRRLDEAINSYDYRARQYSPLLGRFLQRDPIGSEDGANMYVYCGNNPLNCTDPSGTSREERESSLNTGLSTGLAALREVAKPTLKTGGKPTGWLHLWSNSGYGTADAAIQANPSRGDWMFDKTIGHARAVAAEDAIRSANNWPATGHITPKSLYDKLVNDPVWVPASKRLAGGAAFSQLPIQNHFGVYDPDSIQVKYEVPAARIWGAFSAALSGFSGGATIYAAVTSDNAFVATTGTVSGTAEVVGSGMYLTGLLSRTPELSAIGGQFVRFGGGFGLVFVSGHDFINDVSNGDTAGAVGSGAGTGTGIALIAGSGPAALLLGEFTVVYEGSRWISHKTGWGNDSGEEGAAVTNWIQGKDPGTARKGFAYTAGFVVTASGVLVREPLGALDSAIMPEGRTLSPITGLKHIFRGENPF